MPTREYQRKRHQLPEVDTSAEKVAFSSFVGPPKEGLSLVDFLAQRFTYFSRERWTEYIEKGDVLLNGSHS